MRFFALILIRIYQYCLSPLLGPSCRYTPTCSQYAHACIDEFGFSRGSLFALRRLCRCHPWGGSGYDPPPTRLPQSEVVHFPKGSVGNTVLLKKENRLWTGKS